VKLNARSILERLSGPQTRVLRQYEALLRQRAMSLGLVSPRDVGRLWDRHILDSLRGMPCITAGDQRVLDVGSGAGLPGIPLGVARPGTEFVLVEPKRRRAAFLELALESLELPNVSVAPVSASEVGGKAPLCVVRALGSAQTSWRLASPLLEKGGRLLYWAGRSWGDNVATELASVGVRAEICVESEFQWQGPLVIMTRLSTPIPKDHEPT
jgi:16S rRNA (guanine527-N7)-methyltransferase